MACPLNSRPRECAHWHWGSKTWGHSRQRRRAVEDGEPQRLFSIRSTIARARRCRGHRVHTAGRSASDGQHQSFVSHLLHREFDERAPRAGKLTAAEIDDVDTAAIDAVARKHPGDHYATP